jgi:cytosine/adenosine deaminase-related metal-dependent hydrolase
MTVVAGVTTRGPYMGVLDSSGTVAVGKWADLVLLKGNPLEDTYQTIDPAGVMLRGRWLPREELRQVSEELRRMSRSGCRNRGGKDTSW